MCSTATVCASTGSASALQGTLAQQVERNDFARRAAGRRKHHARRRAGSVGLQPARRTQAPTVARLQPGKPEFRARRAQVIADRARKVQKRLRNFHTYHVTADILGAGLATTGPEKTG